MEGVGYVFADNRALIVDHIDDELSDILAESGAMIDVPSSLNICYCVRTSFSPVAKVLLILVGAALFVSNPWRDLWFYEDITAHEGFPTTADTYIVGFAYQLLVTVYLFPVALFLITYGIARSTRISIRPCFDRFTSVWGIVASLLASTMLIIESRYILYGIRHIHHLDTVLISSAYMAFVYIWWTCPLSHRSGYSARSSGRKVTLYELGKLKVVLASVGFRI